MAGELEDEELKRILEKKYREILKEFEKPKLKYGKPIVLNSNNFDEYIQKAKIAIIDFWAEWCMPCKIIAPIIEELAREYPDVLFGKVNVDENPDLAERFYVSAIPTLILFKNGEYQDRIVGVVPKIKLQKLIDSYLSI
ncbi:MAG: thioredoxin [Thermoproteota archaeon]|jgi:thioredoxin 1|nr:thioredoxin [Thermoproteota archaeon]